MKRTVLCTCSFLFLAAVALCVVDTQRASACNSGSDVTAWLRAPQLVTANALGNFGTTLNLNWAFQEIPFIGAAEPASGSVNIAGSPTYTPSYFYPSTCLGAVSVAVSGKLSNRGLNGLLRSRGWVWNSGNPAPFDDDIHNLTVLHK